MQQARWPRRRRDSKWPVADMIYTTLHHTWHACPTCTIGRSGHFWSSCGTYGCFIQKLIFWRGRLELRGAGRRVRGPRRCELAWIKAMRRHKARHGFESRAHTSNPSPQSELGAAQRFDPPPTNGRRLMRCGKESTAHRRAAVCLVRRREHNLACAGREGEGR